MYQLLSLKDKKEYFLDTDEYEYEFLYCDDEWDCYESKPLFSTLLEYLNTDHKIEARNDLIDFICAASKNYNMIQSKYIRPIDINNFCNELYNFFPGDKRKRKAVDLKKHRQKGMTINREFEKSIIQHYLKSYEYDIHYKNVTWIRNYIDKMKDIDTLRQPYIFSLFVQEAREQHLLKGEYMSSVRILEALPYLPKKKRTFKNINEFVDNIYIEKNDVGYEQYLINTFSGWHDIDIIDIVLSDIYFILQQGKTINKCANCGKYFIAYNRSDTMYCQNPSPLDIRKTCKEYASTIGYYKDLKNNEVEQIRGRIRTRLSKRSQRSEYDKADYNAFRMIDKQWRVLLKVNHETKSEYFKWLKDVDIKTKTGGGKVKDAKPLPSQK